MSEYVNEPILAKEVKMKKEFFYGVALYPEWEPEGEWEKDLEKIKEAGFNTIRICEFSWSTFEPGRGKFDFRLYDKVVKRAHELGIYIIMGIDTLSPPAWFFDIYPDAWLINSSGKRAPSRWPTVCFNHPGFKERTALYIKNFVSHYGDAPGLVYYQLDNEPAHHCYCKYCIEKFKVWLEKKYPEEKFPVTFFLPDRQIPEKLWLEWRLFNEEVIIEKIKWIANQVKIYDKEHPLTTNLMMHVSFSPHYAKESSHDVWGLSSVLDIMGMDYYPDTPAHTIKDYRIEDSAAYTLSRCLGRGKGFHTLETKPTTLEAFSGGTWGVSEQGIRKIGDSRRVALWSWRPIAYGAKSLIYWVWRLQHPNVFALSRPDGTLTEYVKITREFSQKINKVYPEIIDANPLPSKVAIIYSKTTCHLAGKQEISEIPSESVLGAFAAIWENRIQVDFINEDEVKKGNLKNYKVAVAPFFYVIDEDIAHALRGFVKNGGYLIIDARFASYARTYDPSEENPEYKLNYYKVPACNLEELTGYKSHMPYCNKEPSFALTEDYLSFKKGTEIPGYRFWDEIEVIPPGKILAKFPEGGPALVYCKYGQGAVLYAALDIFRGYYHKREGRVSKLFLNFLRKLDVNPLFFISNLNPEAERKIEGTFLKKEDLYFLFLINSNHFGVQPEISFCDIPDINSVKDILEDKKIEIAASGNWPTIKVDINPYDVRVLKLSTSEAPAV